MNVRPYNELDRRALEAIRATCPPGAFFADPADAIHPLSYVVEDGGNVVGAIVYRMTAEPFLYVDQTLPAIVKWRAVEALALETAPRLLERGIQELHLFPNDKIFAWRLVRKLRGVFGDTRLHLVWHLSRAFGG